MPGLDPILAACVSAVCYGTSTFLAGRATVRIGARPTLGMFQTTGFACALVLLGALAGLHPIAAVRSDLLLAAVSGLCFTVGWVFLGQGLAFGRTTIVATVECLTSISCVALFEGATVGWSGYLQLVGIGLAGLAAALVALGGRPDPSSSGSARLSVVLGMMAGLLFGSSYLTLGFVSPDDSITALAVMRFVAAAAALVWLGLTRPPTAPSSPRIVAGLPAGTAFALTGGVADGVGTCAFVLATANGLVGVSVAILSLYAAVTVLIGVVVLKERPSGNQLLGLAAALVAIVVLAQ